MRTKTLLLTAAVSAAGIATSMAQVFSVNAVGYINVDVPAGFSMIANQLNNGDNSLNTVIPNAEVGTTIFKFNPTSGGFETATFIADWNPNLTLAPGEGAFIQVGSDTVITFVGEVPQGSLSQQVPAGLSIQSSQVPQAGNLDTDLNFPAEIGDTVFFFRNAGYETSTFIASFNPPAVPEVGEAFFVNKGSAANWTRDFSVNP